MDDRMIALALVAYRPPLDLDRHPPPPLRPLVERLAGELEAAHAAAARRLTAARPDGDGQDIAGEALELAASEVADAETRRSAGA